MENTKKINITEFAEYEDALRSSYLFEDISTDVLSEFLSMSKYIEYPKNSIVYNNEDRADWFYLITKGWVKMYSETMSGDEAIIDIYGASEIFGENAIFENFIFSRSIQAVTNLEVIKLPIGVLADKIEHNPKLAINLSKCINAKNLVISREVEHRETMSAAQRIGCFLLKLCDANSKSQTIHLPFDKVLVAAKLSMKPETFSRALAKLKEETAIEADGKDFQIPSIQKLSEFCCTACSSHYPCGS